MKRSTVNLLICAIFSSIPITHVFADGRALATGPSDDPKPPAKGLEISDTQKSDAGTAGSFEHGAEPGKANGEAPLKTLKAAKVEGARATPTALLKLDSGSLDFTSNSALVESVLIVMQGFLTAEQLEDLRNGLTKQGSSKLATSSDWILKSYEEERLRPNFDEQLFRERILIGIGKDYGLDLAPTEMGSVTEGAEVGTSAGNDKPQPQYLLAVLPLAAIGGGGGGGGGGSSSGSTAADFETTEYRAQFGLGAINTSTAYARGFTGAGVTVSVLDSPFDTDHPDLAGKFTTGYNASTGGTNVSCAVGSCTSTHGTFVAGIIAASRNDSGMHGVAYGATIKPVTIFDSTGTFNVTTAQLASAVLAGSGSGIAVMNNSWGSSAIASGTAFGQTVHFYRPYHYAFAAAVNSAFEGAVSDTVIVFANGNDGHNSATGRIPVWDSALNAQARGATGFVGYASTSTNLASGEGRQPLVNGNLAGAWLTVVALDANNLIANYSNGCGDAKAFCISAPGSSIYSTVDLDYSGSGYSPSGGFGTADGTSFAAPHVAGALAILKQQFPNLTPSQLVSLLISTATDLGAAGVDEVYGVGMLNLASATTPQGVLRVASGGALASDLYTTENTGFRVSRVIGSSLAGLKVGVLDGYNRSYEWSPTISRTSTIDFKPSSYFPANSKQTTMLAADNFELRGELANKNSGSQLTGTTLTWSSDPVSVSLNYASLQQRIPTWSTNASINPSELFAFQVNPGITGLTSISTAHQLGRGFSLFFSTATAGYENGGAFSENSYGLALSSQHYQVVFRSGLLSEKEQFLGTTGYGAYSMGSPAKTTFWSLGSSLKLSEKTIFSSRYSAAKTAVRFKYEELASSSDILTDEFQVSLSRTGVITATGTLSINLQAPLSIKAGQINQSTTLGYAANGDYNTIQRSYSLVGDSRERVLSLVFRQPGRHMQGFAGVFTRLNADGTKGSVDTGIRLGLTSTF
jgi:subtilisin family serine protease